MDNFKCVYLFVSNLHWHVEGTSLWSGNMSGESGGLYRCDATSRAGATHLVYRVSVVTAARVEEIVAYMHGEGTTVVKTLELVVSICLKTSKTNMRDSEKKFKSYLGILD